jgi:ferritin-like metal-binding protein YciE
MPDGNRLNERDSKLVQWLNEAHAKEAELEADLTAHIALTDKQSYKKRLRQHLTETKDHKRRVASRIKQLGGSPTSGPTLPGVPNAVGETAGKAVAAVKGQVGAARAVVTKQAETHLRNAQEELREEHVEMAIYSRIQTFAEAVGDRDTAQLAKAIRRDEERMAKFLDAELGRLVKELVRAVVPRDQRASTTTRRRTSRSRSRSTGSSSTSRSRSGAGSSRSRSSSSSRSSGSRSTGSGSSGSRSTGSRSSGSRSSGSRSSGSRSSSSRSSGSRSTSSRSSGSRSTASRGSSSSRSTSGGSSSGSSS